MGETTINTYGSQNVADSHSALKNRLSLREESKKAERLNQQFNKSSASTPIETSVQLNDKVRKEIEASNRRSTCITEVKNGEDFTTSLLGFQQPNYNTLIPKQQLISNERAYRNFLYDCLNRLERDSSDTAICEINAEVDIARQKVELNFQRLLVIFDNALKRLDLELEKLKSAIKKYESSAVFKISGKQLYFDLKIEHPDSIQERFFHVFLKYPAVIKSFLNYLQDKNPSSIPELHTIEILDEVTHELASNINKLEILEFKRKDTSQPAAAENSAERIVTADIAPNSSDQAVVDNSFVEANTLAISAVKASGNVVLNLTNVSALPNVSHQHKEVEFDASSGGVGSNRSSLASSTNTSFSIGDIENHLSTEEATKKVRFNLPLANQSWGVMKDDATIAQSVINLLTKNLLYKDAQKFWQDQVNYNMVGGKLVNIVPVKQDINIPIQQKFKVPTGIALMMEALLDNKSSLEKLSAIKAIAAKRLQSANNCFGFFKTKAKVRSDATSKFYQAIQDIDLDQWQTNTCEALNKKLAGIVAPEIIKHKAAALEGASLHIPKLGRSM